MIRVNLLLSTALTMVAWQAAAQPAPNARPSGGQVVAGGAAISQANPNSTVITQSTNRAAINWQSFSVGAQQSVDFQQPSSSAVTLNRVTGSDPSAIAGQIHANGGVVLTNPNGVVFSKGAQVNAQQIIVSTAGITNQNFMAGRMVFDQAGNPNATIANAGTITVKDTGLAALVAPQVANSGVISARLGHAVLAGAEAATLDLYGDGLLAVDVTKQVTHAPSGGAALVTNTGVIQADGGNILLTAQAADGVVQNLVAAGGKLSANSVGAKTGAIAIGGTGGSIVITGHLSATGLATGTSGGTIELNADKAVTVAASARVNASGAAGGGTVAIGTSLARAIGGASVTAPTAASTTVAKGARILANATRAGNGGRVTVLSGQTTAMHGFIQAKGSATAGNGGTVEISTGASLTLDGSVDVTAAHGALGSILIDPYDLDITSSFSNTTLTNNTNPNLAYNAGGTTIGNNATITPAQIEALNGNVHLQAVDDINVQSSVTLTTVGQGLTLEAGNSLTVNGGVTISTAGSIALLASSTLIPGFTTTGTLEMLGSVVSSGGAILMQGGTGGVIVAGEVAAPAGGLIDLKGDIVSILTANNATPIGGSGGFISVPGGQLTIEPYSSAHPIELIGTASTATAGSLSVSTTELQLVNAATLALGTSVSGSINIGKGGDGVGLGTISQLSLLAATVTQGAPLTVGTLSGQVTTATLTNASNQIGTISNLSAGGAFALQDAIPLTFAGSDPISGAATIGDTASVAVTGTLGVLGTLTLNVSGAVTEGAAGTITDLGSPLTLSGSVGTLALTNVNSIDVLGALTATSGPISIDDVAPLRITGPVSASNAVITINDTAGAISIVGNLTGTTLNLASNSAITQTGGTLSATTLFAQGTTLSLVGANTIATIGSLIATGGSLAFSDQSSITTTGSVAAAGAISLSTAGNLLIESAINTPGALDLAATGSITEGTAGIIFAGTLTGNAGAGTTLANLNEIASIGTFASTGGFVLNQDTTALTVAGALTDTTSISLSTAGLIQLTGTLSAPTVSLTTTETFSALNSGSTPVTAGQLATIDSIIQSGGGITADVLTIHSGGGVNLQETGTTNSITNVGTVVAANQFNLVDQVAVTITGPGIVSGPTINESATEFYYQYFVSSPAQVVVAAPVSGAVVGLFAGNPGGALSETAAGTITSSFLQGAGASVSLTQTANSIGEIDSLVSGANLAVTSGTPLRLNGAITAGDGGTLIISNDALTLGSSAALSAAGGTVQLGPVNAGDAFTIGNATSISTLTAITADTLVIGSATAGTVTINTSTSNFDASNVGTLTLLSTSDVDETGPHGVIANVLTGTIGGTANLAGANQIGTLGAFTATGELLLATSNVDSTPLTVAGPVSANDLQLSAATPIVITGSIIAPSTTLSTTGSASSISESGAGAITATSQFSVSVNGTGSAGVSLTGANTISSISVGTAGSGGFTLTDAVSLLLSSEAVESSSGLVPAQISSTGPVALTVAGTLSLGGGISGTALNLVTSGPIVESSTGTLTGTSLTGSASAVQLGQTSNSVGTLAAFSSTSGFTLVNAGALSVAGPVSDGSVILIGAGGPLAVTGSLSAPAVELATSSGGAITLAGSISASNDFDLSAGGAVTQTGGLISSAQLSGSAAGAVSLTAGNTIAAIGSFSATGSFSLTDSSALQIGGSLNAPSVNLAISGAIGEGTTAALITTLLTGSGPSASLPSTLNQVGTVGSFSATNGFALTDSVPLTVSGTIAVGTSRVISLSDDSLSFAAGGALAAPGGTIVIGPGVSGDLLTLGGAASVTGATTAAELLIDDSGPISITGPLNFSGVSTLLLVGGGAISESGAGAITAQLLTGSGGAVALGGENTIATLGSFSATGNFALTDSADLALSGGLSAPSVSLVAGGTISEGSGAFISAGTFAGAASAATLSGSNTIATLGSFSAATGLLLADTAALTVSGPVAGGLFTGLAVSGSLGIGGTITGTSLSLSATAGVTEPGGVINVGTLAGNGSAVTLLGTNSIGSLGNISAPGGFQLADTAPVAIAGSIAAGSLASFSGGSPVSEAAGGSLAATTLTVSVGTLALGGSNSIGTLASATAPGGLLLNDTQSLVVTGPAGSGSTAVTSLTAAGSIAITGSLFGGTVNLAATGAASESGTGLINAGTLSGSFASALLGGVNTITALGSITTPASLSLTETGSLNVAGPVTAPTVALSLGGALTESGAGALITGSLSAVATGGISLGGANQITTVTALTSPAAVSLTNAGDLTLAGTISGASVNLVSTGGALSESDGAITTTLLTGGAAGDASLTGFNTVGTLGAFSAGGVLTFADRDGLIVAGPITAGGLDISAAGPISLAGNIATGTFTISAADSILQSSGTITATLLTGNASVSAVFGPDAAGPVADITTLGAFTVSGGTLSVANGQNLNVQGPLQASTVLLSAPGSITLSGGTITTTSGTITAPVIIQGGTTDILAATSQTPVLVLAGSNTVSLSDLEAPAATVQLNTGSGSATGLLDVGALAINGAGGAATLTGAVAGNGTQNAALLATITPAVNTNYTLNGCVIAAATCSIVTPPVTPPPPPQVPPQPQQGEPPLVESIILPPDSGVSIVPDAFTDSDSASSSRSAFRVPFLAGLLAYVFSRDVDDPDLVLPNISDRDY